MEKNQVQIPHDVIFEILLKLPVKSLMKLKIVSKQWLSTIYSKQFSKSYISRSSKHRLCFLFRSIKRHENSSFDLHFNSLSQDTPIISSEEYDKTMVPIRPIRKNETISNYNISISPLIQGFICIRKNRNKFSIFNPTTSQLITLPNLKTYRAGLKHFFGYDPIKEEYKVLCMTVLYHNDMIISKDHQIITVGGRVNRAWRKIECKFPHCPDTTDSYYSGKINSLCKNGFIYYGAWTNTLGQNYQIMRFDVRLEEFSVINLPNDIEILGFGRIDLFNYKGKIGFMKHDSYIVSNSSDLWVLDDDDLKREEWCRVGEIPGFGASYWCRGSFGINELLFAPKTYSDYYVLCHNINTGNRRAIHFQQLTDEYITVDLDHIQNPFFL